MPGKVLQNVCVDCQSAEGMLDIRKRRLCRDCFIKYVNSKALKRMESYRFKSNGDETERRLLLPVSGGVSSLVLLQLLDSQMQRQRALRNRTAYELWVVLIEDPKIVGAQSPREAFWYATLQNRFASVTFLPIQSMHNVFILDPTIEDDLETFGLKRSEGEHDEDFTLRVLGSATSLTAGADLQDILLNRLIVSCASQHGCESILWGHSDSRLAAKALAAVAKGRGGSLPFEICDGPSRSGINFTYPLRDLFKPELSLYASVLPEVFSELLVEDEAAPPEKASIRNTSIDDLLTNYINSQGEKYPSIMANVVRTASKLQSPQLSQMSRSCRVCLVPYQSESEQTSWESGLCYACSRTRQDIRGVKT
jgi:cytoplasmic tRNA 2-thiolation protein 2